jgi:hypothetical protein
MLRAMALLLVTSALSCSASPATPPLPPAPRETATVAPLAPAALLTSCAAKPSTLYGDEPVVFELVGDAQGRANVSVEVLGARGESVFRGTSQVPGTVNAGALPSGDFRLKIAGSSVSCWATVNRELTRGTSDTR